MKSSPTHRIVRLVIRLWNALLKSATSFILTIISIIYVIEILNTTTGKTKNVIILWTSYSRFLIVAVMSEVINVFVILWITTVVDDVEIY